MCRSVGGAAAGLLFQSVMWGLTGAVVAALIPISALAMAARRRLNALQAQVVDVLMIIASSLRAGHSFLQALDMVSKEIAEPAAGEFSRAVSEIRLGRSVDEALSALGDRMASDDFEWAMMAVNIQREVGGNLAEVLDTVAETNGGFLDPLFETFIGRVILGFGAFLMVVGILIMRKMVRVDV